MRGVDSHEAIRPLLRPGIQCSSSFDQSSGSALELLGVVGVGKDKPYKFLAKKIAINTSLFLAVVALTEPYVLQFFGISVDVLQAVGGAVLAAMGWSLLNKPAGKKQMTDPNLRTAAENCLANFWQLSVHVSDNGWPGLSRRHVDAQCPDYEPTVSRSDWRISRTLWLRCSPEPHGFRVLCLRTLRRAKSALALAHDVLRIVAFLLICIGVQIAWHGLRSLFASPVP